MDVDNANDSMRGYISIVAIGAEEPEEAPAPRDAVNDRASQILNSLRQLHAISSKVELEQWMIQKLDDACALICDVVACANRQPQDMFDDYQTEQVEEAAPDTPEGMAPRVDSKGHRSYAQPSGDSVAQQRGFTG